MQCIENLAKRICHYSCGAGFSRDVIHLGAVDSAVCLPCLRRQTLALRSVTMTWRTSENHSIHTLGGVLVKIHPIARGSTRLQCWEIMWRPIVACSAKCRVQCRVLVSVSVCVSPNSSCKIHLLEPQMFFFFYDLEPENLRF